MSRKKHAIRKAPYAHLDFTMRLTPEKAWNAYVRGNLCISVRFFARLHGIPESTWRRELKTATTDNGCEVSHRKALERIPGRPVYYTRAYASYEKGAVENVNRIIRRWFPKGTDFSKVPRGDVLAVETIVNSIHRHSLKGETAYDYHSRLAKKV